MQRSLDRYQRCSGFLKIFFMASVLLAGLSGCQKKLDVMPELPRPVKVQTVENKSLLQTVSYPAEIVPRAQVQLAFRISGKLIARPVTVGTKVKKGQLIAKIDPLDSHLGVAAAQAQLLSAQAESKQAIADLARYQALKESGFISAAEFERHKLASDTAQARVEQLSASFKTAANQSSYTVLTSAVDGVITAVHAEVGQVLNSSQAVVTITEGFDKEVLLAVPENQLDLITHAQEIQVGFSISSKVIKAKIRELSPVADPATRTFIVRLTPEQSGYLDQLAFGMTAVVIVKPLESDQVIQVPVQALYHEANQTYVWVLDPVAQVVKRQPVLVAAQFSKLLPPEQQNAIKNLGFDSVSVSKGLTPGQVIVIAGVHLLKDGQKVRVLN
jgi:RND family efflux transporter MFP subunit